MSLILVLGATSFSNSFEVKAANENDEAIYSDSTGFITTYGMLDKRIDEITFAGTHNAFANNMDRRSSLPWDTYKTGSNLGTMNQNISIQRMLEIGYRYIDLDIGDNKDGETACYHRYRLSGYTNLNSTNGILPKIKSFLLSNPKEIVIIHISDTYNGTINPFKLRHQATLQPGEAQYEVQFNNVLKDMRDTGILEMIYNFSGHNQTPYAELHGKVQTPGQDIPWPTLRQMIDSNKRILFLERDKQISVDLPFKNQNGDPNNTTKENLDLDGAFLGELASSNSHKFVAVALLEDWGAAAGDLNAAYINNEGRKIYGILKEAHNTFDIYGISKTVNGVHVDFATGNKLQGGWTEVSPVDAVNRTNYERFGYEWSPTKVGQWYWE